MHPQIRRTDSGVVYDLFSGISPVKLAHFPEGIHQHLEWLLSPMGKTWRTGKSYQRCSSSGLLDSLLHQRHVFQETLQRPCHRPRSRFQQFSKGSLLRKVVYDVAKD